ncbi:hypothetical protein I7I51_02438 [Histoplasma capsulatum]|uniref:Uncharacterized protein n=1 Tax=Ajellomyces capsulatus TaxID=5037 RepID=A0A8A1M9T4_AJECA|nr:hypothetical protein I7I51_02438 [Histoplasma capsulatum]
MAGWLIGCLISTRSCFRYHSRAPRGRRTSWSLMLKAVKSQSIFSLYESNWTALARFVILPDCVVQDLAVRAIWHPRHSIYAKCWDLRVQVPSCTQLPSLLKIIHYAFRSQLTLDDIARVLKSLTQATASRESISWTTNHDENSIRAP